MGTIVIAVLLLLVLVGVPIAMIVCLTCILIAIVRKIDVARFALAGALYGGFIFPWPYLLARMSGRSLPLPIIGIMYFFPYAIWFGLALGVAGNIIPIWQYTTGIGSHYVAPNRNFITAVLLSVVLLCISGISIYSMLKSIAGFCSQYRKDRLHPPEDDMPDIAYIKPFAYSYAWLVGGLPVALIVAAHTIFVGLDIQGI